MREQPRIVIPPKVKARDKVLAKDHNALIDAVRLLLQMVLARTPQPGPDIGVRYGPGGAVSFLKRKPAGGGAGGGQPLSGSIVAIPDTDPVEYGARFTPGYLLYQNACSELEQGTTGYLEPRLAGRTLDDPEIEPLPLPALASYVYLRVKTTSDGMPKEDGITIEAFDSPQTSTHHVRDNPSSGAEEGDYYLLLLETESNGATPTPAPRVKRRIAGHQEMPNQLVEIRNIGGKRELYSGYQVGPDDTHEIRTLEQKEVPQGVQGAEVLVPLNPGSPAEDPVIVDGVVVTPGKPAVPPEEEGPTIKIRYLRKGNSASTPYTISGDGDAMRLQFTGGSGRFDLPGNGFLEFLDGLFTGGAPSDPSQGWWGELLWVTGGGLLRLGTTWQEGRLMTVFQESGGGERFLIAGTEQAPGSGVVNVGS